jgi:plasmid stability protein
MPEDLTVEVSDELEAWLRERARKNGRTIEEEHRAILEEKLGPFPKADGDKS